MGVKIIPRGRLLINQSGTGAAFYMDHSWEIVPFYAYLVPSSISSPILAKDFIAGATRDWFHLGGSDIYRVLITDTGGGSFNLQDRTRRVLSSSTTFSALPRRTSASGLRLVYAPTLSDASSYDSAVLTFTKSSGVNVDWRIYQYG